MAGGIGMIGSFLDIRTGSMNQRSCFSAVPTREFDQKCVCCVCCVRCPGVRAVCNVIFEVSIGVKEFTKQGVYIAFKRSQRTQHTQTAISPSWESCAPHKNYSYTKFFRLFDALSALLCICICKLSCIVSWLCALLGVSVYVGKSAMFTNIHTNVVCVYVLGEFLQYSPELIQFLWCDIRFSAAVDKVSLKNLGLSGEGMMRKTRFTRINRVLGGLI